MNSIITYENIQNIVSSFIEGTDMFIVEIALSKSNNITVSIDSPQGVDIDTCVELSRYIEQHLDREQEDFELTVASAGLSEPFKVHKQYLKNIGKLVQVLTTEHKKYIGTLTSVTEQEITLTYTELVKMGPKGKKKEVESTITIPFTGIKKTTLEIIFK
ncbi:MAG TPA: ribosome assembly cofactor RimP [Bacteroidales bacterium]|jgi:ribosome maturation factor RimP|nr:ribosome assembly cofactor RimP [Bacteroidales bacterium]HRS18468.1 ribosome assembly cofactor RimP [Bacteroidales bacterium]